MDPLAHTFLGAALGRTRIGRDLPNAMLISIVAANAPDADVLAYVKSSDTALAFRRGWTHGPIGLVLLTALLFFLVPLWSRRRSSSGSVPATGRLLLLIVTGVLSHPALDWLNTYGIRFLMPFDERWFYGDTLFIADPWVWLLLGGSVYLGSAPGRLEDNTWLLISVVATVLVVAVPSGLVLGKILWCLSLVTLFLARQHLGTSFVNRSERLATVGLALFLFYAIAMLVSSQSAERLIRSTLDASRNFPAIEDVMVGPLPVDPWQKDVVIVTAHGYRFARFDWLHRPRVDLTDLALAKPPDTPLVAQAFADPCVRGFVRWVRFPFVEVDEAETGTDVYLLDARYTRSRTRGFGSAHVLVED